MNAFEQAIEDGAIDLDGLSPVFPDAKSAALYVTCAENTGDGPFMYLKAYGIVLYSRGYLDKREWEHVHEIIANEFTSLSKIDSTELMRAIGFELLLGGGVM